MHLESVRSLLYTTGINIDLRDALGRNAYMDASQRGFPEIAKLLQQNTDEAMHPMTEACPFRQPSRKSCNICHISVYQDQICYHCNICDGEDVDICRFCFANGASCSDPTQQMIRIEPKTGNELT